MGIAAVGNIHLPAVRFRNCYKVLCLTKTILDTTQISNLRDRYVLGGQLGWGQFGVIRFCLDKLTGDVFAFYEDEDSVHLVMELCAGGELFHLLEKHGRFSESEARLLFKHLMQVVNGMPPFGGKTKSKIFDAVKAAELRFPIDPWDHISLSARDLIIGMLCVDPSKRLSAAQVLDHPWVEGCRELTQDCRELEVGGRSSSTLFIKRNQDYTFSDGSFLSFNGKSSFSFIVENGSPSAAELFSSPIPTVPSFTFFSPISAVEPQNAETSKMSDEQGDSSDPVEQKTELRKGGLLNGSQIPGIHSKRNHTIGLGEFNHFDHMVTESVIRWASCTHIPTAPSLRLSLVC
ncbi:Detected protein of confused Function [Hibiscus syriacus]|uniref:Detected protein of confused Function n=1 Tax=Hibiscus syriacus TaxID=106335 RepID=A0A6A2XQ80_HIBSY|nr:Detected protein of confused Function [Hibiscus syriacus]